MLDKLYKKDFLTSCIDWEVKIKNGQSLIPPPLFPEVADQAEKIFKQFVLVDVMGQPTLGEAAAQWVIDFVRVIFGALHFETQTRLIREFFLLISKKNSKSTIAAGVMLTALLMNQRASAELIIIAPTKEVADNSFIPIRDFINADEYLAERFNVSEHTKTITDVTNSSILKVIAAETNAAAGKKATIILIDEVHVFGKRNNAGSMFREAKGGLASRPEGCVIYLTTQSEDTPSGVFKELLDYARDVRDGIVLDKTFLPILYEFPKDMLENDEHLKPENFHITNPNLGVSVSRHYLETEFLKAQRGTIENFKDFLAKHLNVEIGMNLRANRWAGAEFWLPQVKKLGLQDILDNATSIAIGCDGGGLDDLFGFAVIGRVDGEWLVWTHAWCHEIVLERRKSEAERLRQFEKEGDLTIYTDVKAQLAEVASLIKLIEDSGKLLEVGFDPMMLGGIIEAITDEGVSEDKLVDVPQGFKLTGYIQTAERKLAAKEMWHCGSAMMTWVVGNAKIKQSGAGIMICKQLSGAGKIDPIIAVLNAVAVLLANPEREAVEPVIHFI